MVREGVALGEGQGEAVKQLKMPTREEIREKPVKPWEIDLKTIESPVLRRLIEEVKSGNTGKNYDRVHSRHYRS